MFDAEQNDARNDIIKVSRTERARETNLGPLIVADADQIDIAFAVDLSAGQKKDVDAALAGAVKQFARAIGEDRVRAAAKKRHERFARIMQIGAFAREERGGCGNRRSRANGDMTRVTDQSADDVGKQFLVAERFRLRAF